MIDLHLHTINSGDAKNTPEQIVEYVVKNNFDCFSITDHDSVASLEKTEKLIKNTPVKFLRGIELTTSYKNKEIHLLVYNFEIEKMRQILSEREGIVKEKRHKELETTIKLFRKQGFEIDNNIDISLNKTVGYLTALNVYNKPKNQELLIKKHQKLLTNEEFYNSYQAPGKPCFVPKSNIEVDWFLEKLKSLTEDIILAHPFVAPSFSIQPLIMDEVLELIDIGVKGLEIYHDKTSKDQIKQLEKIVKDKSLYFTGGSDNHGQEDDIPIGYYNQNDKVLKVYLSNITKK